MVYFLSPKSRRLGGWLPPQKNLKKNNKTTAIFWRCRAFLLFMDLFIHLLVHLFVYLFIDMSIPLSVHSFRHSFFQILSQPNTFPDCIYWKNASRDLSDCFTLYKVSNELAKGSNASVDLLAFIILGPNKGDQLKKSPCIKDLNCCILKESKQRLIRLLHSLQSFPINGIMDQLLY